MQELVDKALERVMVNHRQVCQILPACHIASDTRDRTWPRSTRRTRMH
jgi:hypothetical protein